MKLAYMMATPDAGAMPLAWSGEPKAIVEKLAAIGYDGVELQIRDPDAFDHRAFRKRAGDAGLAVCAVSTGQVGAVDGLYLIAAEPDVRRRAIERFARVLQLAAEYGVDASIGRFRGVVKSAPSREVGLEWFSAALEELVPEAERLGIRIVLEPQHRFQCDTLNTIAETLAFIEAFGSDHLVFEGDLHHMQLEERSIVGAIVQGVRSGKMTHFQVADSNRLAPGWGYFNWIDILETLRASGYDAWISMEFTQRPDSETCARQAYAHVTRILAGGTQP